MNPENMITYQYEYEEVVQKVGTIELEDTLGEDSVRAAIKNKIEEEQTEDIVYYELFDFYTA